VTPLKRHTGCPLPAPLQHPPTRSLTICFEGPQACSCCDPDTNAVFGTPARKPYKARSRPASGLPDPGAMPGQAATAI
jgi:hypothetical protein